MPFIRRDDSHFLPEPVQNNAHDIIFTSQRNLLIKTTVHGKCLLGKLPDIKILKPFFSDTPPPGNACLLHLVHPEMFDTVRPFVIGNEIIICIVPGKRPRTYRVKCPVLLRLQSLLHRPLRIFVLNLPVLQNGSVNLIHIVIDCLIACLGTVVDEDIPLKLLSVIFAGQAL